MTLLQTSLLLLFTVVLGVVAVAQNQQPPQAEISNGILRVGLYLPNAQKGFYRGTRFDWSGVMRSLEYKGHQYYGPWFTKTDQNVIDFIFDGPDIIAGPCSAITGPVEEFSSNGKALGFDEARPGGTFIKIGIGVLRRPDDQDYNPYRLYDIVNPGKWIIRPGNDSVEFIHELRDPESGYAYQYTKVVRLNKSKPEMSLEHRLKNTGRRSIETSVYDHNFLVLDNQPIGPDFMLTVPFGIKIQHEHGAELALVQGHQFTYRKELTGRDTVSGEFSGFGDTAADYKITIENRKIGAGMTIEGDRPLSKENLWSIRSVLAAEPFIRMSIEPGKTFAWRYNYTYYLINERTSK